MDPYAPKSSRTERFNRPTLDIARLARLGADAQVLSEIEDRWNRLPTDKRKYWADTINTLPDSEVTKAVIVIADQLRFQVIAEDRSVEQQAQRAIAEEFSPPSGSIPEVMDWVGDDRERALDALRHEKARDSGPRITLTKKLQAVLDAAD